MSSGTSYICRTIPPIGGESSISTSTLESPHCAHHTFYHGYTWCGKSRFLCVGHEHPATCEVFVTPHSSSRAVH
jgi:metallophosphoesterase superfamily enzyme